jgi:hypothetical protein
MAVISLRGVTQEKIITSQPLTKIGLPAGGVNRFETLNQVAPVEVKIAPFL